MDYYKEIKKANYGQNVCTMVEGGSIDFDPKKCKEVVGAERMTYDEYLDVQFASLGKTRGGFACCFTILQWDSRAVLNGLLRDEFALRQFILKVCILTAKCLRARKIMSGWI